MSVFDHPDFDGHEDVVFVRDPASGLRAIIAIHSTAAGPACGGIRFWPYASDDDALTDALRLSRGMSYKNVMAGLPIGGGKSVIMADAARTKNGALLHAFGRAIDRLGGAYIAAEDVGITTGDIAVMREVTPHVAGRPRGANASGDPSPFTALGVFLGLKAAVRFRLGEENLTGLRIGVQGLGAVGMKLARHLHEAGARLLVADLDPARVQAATAAFAAESCPSEALPGRALDVLAPCALGGLLTPEVIASLQARVIAGAANNQLATPACGALLHARGILYAPDYVINAGGVINVAGEVAGDYDERTTRAAIERIPATLEEIFNQARLADLPASEIADAIARRRLAALRSPALRHAA